MSNRHIASMLQDEDLIKGCAKGDRASQRALYDRYCRKMMPICQRYAKSDQEAEDILQEGFVKVFSNISKFRAEAQLGTWITRIMINTALNAQRSKMYMLPMVDVEEGHAVQQDDVVLSHLHLTELLKLIQSLPDGCQVVFNLFAIEGYSHKEISDALGISVGTSKSQFNRAKSLLREKIDLLDKEKTSYGKATI
ncbi:MAG: sigma-70 family RNA polymerase sigma factor [Cyclobacteriaceae bacterium]